MMKFGYPQSNRDDTLFFKHSISNTEVLLILFLGDIIITGDDYIEI